MESSKKLDEDEILQKIEFLLEKFECLKKDLTKKKEEDKINSFEIKLSKKLDVKFDILKKGLI